jgi:hypothetical protein
VKITFTVHELGALTTVVHELDSMLNGAAVLAPVNVTDPLVTVTITVSGALTVEPVGIPKDRLVGETENVAAGACASEKLAHINVSAKIGINLRREFPNDFICPPSGEPGNTKSQKIKAFFAEKKSRSWEPDRPGPD